MDPLTPPGLAGLSAVSGPARCNVKGRAQTPPAAPVARSGLGYLLGRSAIAMFESANEFQARSAFRLPWHPR